MNTDHAFTMNSVELEQLRFLRTSLESSGAAMTSAEVLALLDVNPAAGILAAADLREQRARSATQGTWVSDGKAVLLVSRAVGVLGGVAEADLLEEDAEHIAAEATPAHSLTAARRWKKTAERHRNRVCRQHIVAELSPCIDLVETADEVRAYLAPGALIR